MKKFSRQTKIIWSFDELGAVTENVTGLAEKEIDCLRIVAHDDMSADKAERFIQEVRKGSAKRTAVMLDIGSQIRGKIQGFSDALEVLYGDTIQVYSADQENGKPWIETSDWDSLFEPDASLFFGFGNVVGKVISANERFIDCEIVQGGTIYSGTEIHVPATRELPNFSQLNSHALDTLRRFLELGVDYVVAPGMPNAEDLEELKRLISQQSKSQPYILLKVDAAEVNQVLDELLDSVDGVVVSRRELALAMEPATVPMVTKQIIQKCNDKAKMVVTASDMLASMRHNPTPTRAEVSDIANSVMDGTDAVVISEEVTGGRHASRALEFAKKIIQETEEHSLVRPNWIKLRPSVTSEFDAVAYGAYRTAERVKAKAIVCITESGNTPLKLASFRAPVPILAVTFDRKVQRRLTLVRGVRGLYLDANPTLDDVLPEVSERLKRDSWLETGDSIIFVSITLSSVGREASNMFTVQRIS